VAIECDCFFTGEASWAALTLGALQREWWDALDVSAACHQTTRLTLVVSMVDASTTACLAHQLCLI
jgi:hypothetical protein